MKPGNRATRSGQYEIIGSRGASTGVERTVVKGEPLPPTPKSGQTYKLVDPTKMEVVEKESNSSTQVNAVKSSVYRIGLMNRGHNLDWGIEV